MAGLREQPGVALVARRAEDRVDLRARAVPGPAAIDIDAQGVYYLYPGIRIVSDRGGDLGLFEFGVSGGASVGSLGGYKGLIRAELRWSF